jgi:LmbE family N-acetylglucosaminyl deacetylase
MTPSVSQRSCLVLAPHQDDETLGCGATILRKTRVGAEVRVLFASDGRYSHRSSLLTPDQLARRREQESVEACERLGVPGERVMHLRLEETGLAEQKDAIGRGICRVLSDFDPQEIYFTSALDGHPDHVALAEATVDLVARNGIRCELYEYPVWFWMERWRRTWTRRMTANACGLKWRFGEFTRSLRPRFVATAGFLELKRHALMAHESQMTKLDGRADWATLEEVGDGRFLPYFFGPYEIFFALESE